MPRECLQDVHWSCGLIGYFPTYALGNLYASQLFEQAATDLGDLNGQFRQGEFEPLLGWLRKNIHGQRTALHGCRDGAAGNRVASLVGGPLEAFDGQIWRVIWVLGAFFCRHRFATGARMVHSCRTGLLRVVVLTSFIVRQEFR